MNNLKSVDGDSLGIDVWIHQRSFRLYVPVADDNKNEVAEFWVAKIRKLGLESVLPIIYEDVKTNVEILQCCWGRTGLTPEPYLQETVEGETGAVIFFVGDEIAQGLEQLAYALGAGCQKFEHS
jgi:hypothetical protein